MNLNCVYISVSIDIFVSSWPLFPLPFALPLLVSRSGMKPQFSSLKASIKFATFITNLDKYCDKQIEASIHIPHCYVWRFNSPCPGGLRLSNFSPPPSPQEDKGIKCLGYMYAQFLRGEGRGC